MPKSRSRRHLSLVSTLGVVLGLLAPVVLGVAAEPAQADPWDGPQPPTELTVGQLPSPRDVADLDAPLLGWQVRATRQTAYEVQVAETVAGLGEGGVWDSGKVASGTSTNVKYAGPALAAAESYAWRVR